MFQCSWYLKHRWFTYMYEKMHVCDYPKFRPPWPLQKPPSPLTIKWNMCPRLRTPVSEIRRFVRSSVLPTSWYLWHSSNAKQPSPTNRPTDRPTTTPATGCPLARCKQSPTRPSPLRPTMASSPRPLAQVSQIFQPSLPLSITPSPLESRGAREVKCIL